MLTSVAEDSCFLFGLMLFNLVGSLFCYMYQNRILKTKLEIKVDNQKVNKIELSHNLHLVKPVYSCNCIKM